MLTIILSAALIAAIVAAIMIWRRSCAAETALRDNISSMAALTERNSALEGTLQQERGRHAEEVQRLRDEADARVRQANEAAQTRIDDLRRVHDEALERERHAVSERFKAMASDVLSASSRQLDERSRASIETVLAPLRTSLQQFTADFKACYNAEQTERLSLREGIQGLADLNRIIGDETRRLTQALKGDNRWQGQWGEMVLKNILEASGLEEGRSFILQHTVNDDDQGRRLRPDAVILCPEDRKIVIDSKVSLTSYLQLRDDELTPEQRKSLIKAHLASIDAHISELVRKEYQQNVGVNKNDFVVMFIPHEGAFMAAVQANPALWENGFKRHVIIASPTHLITLLKLIEQQWITYDSHDNSLKIIDEAVKLLNKLNGSMADMLEVERALKRASDSFDSAMSKLSTGRGSVMNRYETIRKLGARAAKELPGRLSTLSDEDAE